MSCTSFESLPTEILFQVYEYFDVRALYILFFNLNRRFNELLRFYPCAALRYQSPDDHLPLVGQTDFAERLRSLTIHSANRFPFDEFRHLRRLTLWYPTDEQLTDLRDVSLNDLQLLSVTYTVAKASICALYERIFSNGFPSLRKCFLFGRETPRQTSAWRSSPRLEFVHLSWNFSSVLHACPNLLALNLSLATYPQSVRPLPPRHGQLRSFRLTLTSIHWIHDENYLQILFASMPQLQHFVFDKIFSLTNSLENLFRTDWLSALLERHFPLLSSFVYHL